MHCEVHVLAIEAYIYRLTVAVSYCNVHAIDSLTNVS